MRRLSLIAVMALGGLVAFSMLATAQEAGKDTKKGGKRGFPSVEQQMERMTTQLNLTDDQKPKVKAALEAQDKKMKELRKEGNTPTREQFQEVRKETQKKMKEILTEDQYKKYEEMGQRMGKKSGKKTEKKSE